MALTQSSHLSLPDTALHTRKAPSVVLDYGKQKRWYSSSVRSSVCVRSYCISCDLFGSQATLPVWGSPASASPNLNQAVWSSAKGCPSCNNTITLSFLQVTQQVRDQQTDMFQENHISHLSLSPCCMSNTGSRSAGSGGPALCKLTNQCLGSIWSQL